jgi:hypothetical protein
MSSDFVISKSRSPILHAENQRSRSLLTLTAAITSRNRISRFRGSRCQVILTFQSPDPRSPILHAENQRSRITSNFNGCDYIAKSHIAISGFSLSRDFDISKSRSPIPDTPCRESTVQITSNFNGCDYIAKSHIAISGFSLSRDFDISKSRSPILHAKNQRSRSLLTLAAAIKSRNRISRFRGSRCQVNWTFQNPDS